jgi:tRNA uracil 4-sulfurtransferase
MQQVWILRFGELGLKSRVVRRQFQRALSNNMERLATNSGISLFQDRIKSMEVVSSSSDSEVTENLLCHVLGVVAIDPASIIAETIEPKEVAKAILATDVNAGKPRTFGVRTRRVGPKGQYRSQDYSGEIGHELCVLDSSLSVNLSNPDIWVRLVLEPERVWLLGRRITSAGGLPPGVQGDVFCKVTDEKSLLSAFLIMRRGSRLIPVDGCDEDLLEILKQWDPFLGRNSMVKNSQGQKRTRHPWGVVGLSSAEGESLIQRRETDVKTVPISTLEPLCGWTKEEIDDLSKHIRMPNLHPCMPNLEAWVS